MESLHERSISLSMTDFLVVDMESFFTGVTPLTLSLITPCPMFTMLSLFERLSLLVIRYVGAMLSPALRVSSYKGVMYSVLRLSLLSSSLTARLSEISLSSSENIGFVVLHPCIIIEIIRNNNKKNGYVLSFDNFYLFL